MFLGQAKVTKVDLGSVFFRRLVAHDEVRRFYVTMDNSSTVHILDGLQHLQQDSARINFCEACTTLFSVAGHVAAFQFEDYEVLFVEVLL